MLGAGARGQGQEMGKGSFSFTLSSEWASRRRGQCCHCGWHPVLHSAVSLWLPYRTLPLSVCACVCVCVRKFELY